MRQVGTGAPSLSIDQSLSEVRDDLDAAFFVSGLATNGAWVVFGNLSWPRFRRADSCHRVGPDRVN